MTLHTFRTSQDAGDRVFVEPHLAQVREIHNHIGILVAAVGDGPQCVCSLHHMFLSMLVGFLNTDIVDCESSRIHSGSILASLDCAIMSA